jgi:acyl-CoA thioesterase FadM
MRYRRSLELFEPFTLHTRLLGWDEKWVFLEQRFLKQSGDLAAEGVVKALFRGKDGNVPMAEVLHLMDYTGPQLEVPEAIRRWAKG